MDKKFFEQFAVPKNESIDHVTTSFGVTLVKGYEVKINHFVNLLEQQNLNVKVIEMDQIHSASGSESFYFISNFRNLLTSYELDFLKSNPLIKNILMMDPDFDEYEDVVCDFRKRYPGMTFFVFDERALATNAAAVFSLDQIDLIQSNVKLILASEMLRNNKFDFNSLLKTYSRFSVEDSEKLLSDFRSSCLQNIFFQLQWKMLHLNVSSSKIDLFEIGLDLSRKKSLLCSNHFMSLYQFKFWSIYLFLATLLMNFLIFATNGDKQFSGHFLMEFLSSHTTTVTFFTTVFLTIHCSLIFFESKADYYFSEIEQRDQKLRGFAQTASHEHQEVLKIIEIFREDCNQEFTKCQYAIDAYIQKNPFRAYNQLRNEALQKNERKKAA